MIGGYEDTTVLMFPCPSVLFSLSWQAVAYYYFYKYIPSEEKIKYACVLKLSMPNGVLKNALMESVRQSFMNIVILGWPVQVVSIIVLVSLNCKKVKGWVEIDIVLYICVYIYICVKERHF